ncbi:MAG: MFS transporter [Patescibacteria group bacterium]|nr:MFS transporter [Patescibacteria group bacterium]
MIISEDHLSQHHIFRIKNTELNEIYAVMSIRSLVIALINIFIPIYLYTITFSLQKIVIFYLVMFAGEALLEYPALKVIARFGPKHSIAFSLPFLVMFFWMLWTLPQSHWPLWLIGLVGSVSTAFFWQAYHYDFSKSKIKNKATKEISMLYIVLAVLGALGPLIGGLIAGYLGIGTLIGIVTGLVLLTIFPLYIQREPHVRHQTNLKKAFNINIFAQQIAYGGNGIEVNTTMVFWPLFLFFVVGTYQNVGFVTAAALFVTVIVTYFIGTVADRRSKTYFIGAGSLLTSVLGFLRIFVYSLPTALILNVVRGISHSIYESPFIAEYYLHADEESRPEYIFWMEFGIDIARVLYFGTLFVLSFYLNGNSLLVWALIIGAAATALMVFMPPAKNESNAIN